MLKRLFAALSILASFSSFTALAAGATPAIPALSKIDCTGKTSDGRAATVSIVFNPAATSYPAAAIAHLQISQTGEVGATAPETLAIQVAMSSGQDVSSKTVYLFNAPLDGGSPSRVFGARTFDLRTGVGALKLEGSLRAPMLSCTFTPAAN